MEAASVAAVPATKNKQVSLGSAQARVVGAGALLIVVSMFLKAVKIPSNVVFLGKTTYISAGGGVLALAMAAIAVIFLVIAKRRQRKGLVWGTIIFSVFAIGWSVLNVAGGFTIQLVSGGSVHADPAIAPFVALVGGVVMLVAALAVRASAKPLSSQDR